MRLGVWAAAAIAACAVACSAATDTASTTTAATASTTSAPKQTTTVRPKAGATTSRPIAAGLEGLLIDAFALNTGDCFNHYTHYGEDFQPIEIFTQRSCQATHDGEVFYRIDYSAGSDGRYPGREVLGRFATKACYEAFQPYVGISYETSTFKLSYLIPPQERWEKPSLKLRTISCYLTQRNTKLTESARGSAT